MEKNNTTLNQVRIHLNNSSKKANSQNALPCTSKKIPMLICNSLTCSDTENKLPNCKRKKRMYLKDK